MKETIKEIINSVKIADFSTINANNFPESRALSNELNQNNLNENLELYFATYSYSEKIEQIKNNNNTSVYYNIPENMKNITLFGKTEIINDQNIKDSFWKEHFINYYKEGKNDPAYMVIKFTPKSYKYYSVENGEHKKNTGNF